MDAEDLLLRQFLGILTPEQTAASAVWIHSQQRSDGTWANFFGGPPDLSTTIEAYVALRLAGDPADAAHLQKAAAFVRDSGGLERSRVFTRIWLALFGLWPWEKLPVLPPEIMFLPPWFPLNIYDFGCWARQTVVALTVVSAHRPVRPIPVGIDKCTAQASATVERASRSWRTWPGQLSSGSTICSIATSAWRSNHCVGWPSSGPSSGSSPARKPTVRGAASSRHGSIR